MYILDIRIMLWETPWECRSRSDLTGGHHCLPGGTLAQYMISVKSSLYYVKCVTIPFSEPSANSRNYSVHKIVDFTQLVAACGNHAYPCKFVLVSLYHSHAPLDQSSEDGPHISRVTSPLPIFFSNLLFALPVLYRSTVFLSFRCHLRFANLKHISVLEET